MQVMCAIKLGSTPLSTSLTQVSYSSMVFLIVSTICDYSVPFVYPNILVYSLSIELNTFWANVTLKNSGDDFIKIF
jgi:hypothetical protein